MSLLDSIVENTKRRVRERAERVPLDALLARLPEAPPVRSFHAALSAQPFSVIAEHKRKSPSGGFMMAANVDAAYATYAKLPWVSAISVLTDEDYFAGHVDDLAVARRASRKPILRKDFIVDPYQVLEARVHGADAILLMASVLHREPTLLASLYHRARELGLDVLIEMGTTERRIEDLVAIIPAEARILGINARQFRSTEKHESRILDPNKKHVLPTDLSEHHAHRKLIAKGRLAVAESGIHTADELSAVRDAGYDAALVGTAFLSGPRTIDDVTEDFRRVFTS